MNMVFNIVAAMHIDDAILLNKEWDCTCDMCNDARLYPELVESLKAACHRIPRKSNHLSPMIKGTAVGKVGIS